MKSIATTAIAALMLLGTVSAIATSNNNSKLGFSDGGPVPLCQPTDPSCPSPMPTVKAQKAKMSDGGPVPLCQPTDPSCPSPMPTVR